MSIYGTCTLWEYLSEREFESIYPSYLGSYVYSGTSIPMTDKYVLQTKEKKIWRIKYIQSSIYYHSQCHLYGPIRNFNPIVWVLCISSMFSLDIAKNKQITLSQWVFMARPNMNNVWVSIELVLYETRGLKGWLDVFAPHI